MDLATSGAGGLGNYIGICAIVAAFGVADAFVEGGMVGDLSFMCPEFIQVRLSPSNNSCSLIIALFCCSFVSLVVALMCFSFSRGCIRNNSLLPNVGVRSACALTSRDSAYGITLDILLFESQLQNVLLLLL